MFLLYVVFTLVHTRFQQYTIYQRHHYCEILMLTNKLSYAGAYSEIDSKGAQTLTLADESNDVA